MVSTTFMKKRNIDVSELALNLNYLTSTYYDTGEDQSKDVQSGREAETQLKNIMLEMAAIPDSEFSWNHTLRTELGLDSLDMVELVMICEKDFGISISDKEWQLLSTAGNLRDLVISRLPSI